MSGEVQSDEHPPAVVMAGGTPLTFDWQPGRWRKTRLMVALAVAAAGHLLVFYLFQVVTESPPRQAPPVQQVLMLPASQEAPRRLLEMVEDRFPGLSNAPEMAAEDARELAALVKGYVPTWLDHRPRLKPLPGQAGSSRLPPLMANPALLLPPLPPSNNEAVVPQAAQPITRPLPILSFQTGLSGRPLLTGPVWPAEVTGADWPEEGKASFMISVTSEGTVSSCLPLGVSTGLDEEILRQVLLKLKFAPVPEASGQPIWGWVDVLW